MLWRNNFYGSAEEVVEATSSVDVIWQTKFQNGVNAVGLLFLFELDLLQVSSSDLSRATAVFLDRSEDETCSKSIFEVNMMKERRQKNKLTYSSKSFFLIIKSM